MLGQGKIFFQCTLLLHKFIKREKSYFSHNYYKMECHENLYQMLLFYFSVSNITLQITEIEMNIRTHVNAIETARNE